MNIKIIRAVTLVVTAVAIFGLTACGASANTASTNSTTLAATQAPVAQSADAPSAKFNLNLANADQIKSVPNTGDRMVREFTEYRPYTSILQFRQEIGKYVGAEQVAEYEKYFYVPVSFANADTATLQQLPGVNAEVAAKLIAARPYADKAAFLKKLTELTDADTSAAGAGFVEAQ